LASSLGWHFSSWRRVNRQRSDRHLATVQGVTRVEYARDMTGRIVDRKVLNTTGGGSIVSEEQRFVSSANGDTPDMTLDAAGNLLERG